MSQSTSHPSWIGKTIGGRYQIEALLGQGGMSSVFKGTDPNLRRTVAVKIIHPHLSVDQEFVRRFEQEAAAVAQLRHQNIIQVYDFNNDGAVYYMVLEFVPGQTLQERLTDLTQQNQRLPLAQAVKITATTSDAVAYAHDQGMIYRDLKPANVMLNPNGQPILMDFGVAKMLDAAQHTATGAIIGTAKYMSPEQARGDRPDERTDIYSLGVMLYEMVTGSTPFDGESTVAILMKHVTETLPNVRHVKPDIPEALAQVIEKSLAKDRENRYQTATDLAEALRAADLTAPALAAEPDATVLHTPAPAAAAPVSTPVAAPTPAATPPTPSPAAQKSGGGPPMGLIGAGVIGAIIVIGLIAGLFLMGGGGDENATGENGPTAAAGVDTATEEAAPTEETEETGATAPTEEPTATDIPPTPEPEPTEEPTEEPTDAPANTDSAADSLPADTASDEVTNGEAADAEETAEAAAAPTEEPTPTDVPPTPTPEPEPTEPPTPTVAPAPAAPPGMVFVPSGFFLMGSDVNDANERPEHPVLLDGFFIDRTEVTNAAYRQCVEAGSCTPPQTADAFTYPGYRDDPAFDDYPVISVDWNQAQAYCQFVGKRLPTEAEWEYAAGGPDNLVYPWGNTFNASLSAASADDTQPVGSFPQGASPFGALDMAGNVGEWVADTFSESFYGNSPASNPFNNAAGDGRIFRGGSFANPDGEFYRTSKRYGNVRSFSEVDIGIRCAQDAPNAGFSETLAEEFCAVYTAFNPAGACP